MILAYRVLERRIKALRIWAILHVFFVLNLNMHKHDDFMNAYCDKKGITEVTLGIGCGVERFYDI